jgi:hypothetical protein
MKKYLLGAAAALAIAAPGLAHAEDAGSVGVHYANIDPSGGDSADVYGLDITYAHDFSNGWTVQGDGSSERISGGIGFDEGVGFAALSAGMRGESGDYYGFVGNADFFEAITMAGVGGRWNVNNATIGGDVGYADLQDGHAWQADVNGAYFLNNNFGLNADLGYVDFSDGGGHATVWGLGGTYRFTGSPVALDLGYQRGSEDSEHDNVWRLGLSWQFGSDSAQSYAQHGANFDGSRHFYNEILDAL